MTNNDLKVGDMFFIDPAEWMEDGHYRWPAYYASPKRLSSFYKNYNQDRLPILIMLPSRVLWCVDSMCVNSGNWYGGWSVTGKAPNISVSPSINVGGHYHGFLTNGVIGNDVEGRKYSDSGELVYG
jgi:hypothetical protein